MIRLLLIIFCTASATAAAQDKRLPMVEDMERLVVPSPPVMSPDGRRVAYAADGAVYVVGTGGGDPVRVTSAGRAWSPRWSADGDELYFVSDRAGVAQVFRLPVDGFGEATQVTRLEQGVAATELSPDETRILLTLSAADLGRDESTARDALPPPFVVTRLQMKRDRGQGYLTDADTRHLYSYDIGDNALVQVTAGRFDEDEPAWSPDGQSIVFASNREAEPDATYRSDIWIVPVSGGAPRQLTDSADAKSAPAFSPDGGQVAYLSAGDGVYSVQQLAIVPVDGGESRILTNDLDRWVDDFRFSPDGRWIYFTYDNAGATELGRIRVANGRFEKLVDGNVSVAGFDVGAGASVALELNTENDTRDVYVLDDGELRQLTHLNRDYFDEVLVGRKQKFAFEGPDGTTIEAFITTPPDYRESRRYPAILNLHGGPVGQFGWGYSFRSQYFAANGYVVIEPNPRGSTGFGEDYIRAIYRTWGITDFPDDMAAVDFAVAEGFADPDRLAVTGYSYGGYMTNMVITQTNRFKAAAAGAGHSLIEANFGHDIYQKWYVWELGYPWEHRDRYDRLSPLLRVDRVETPTLYLGGRSDWNVPLLNAELMYQSLRVRGIETELVVYPGMHHGGWPSQYEQDYLRRIVDWFDRHVKD